MIKARGKTGVGEDLVFLGLSGENVTRLVAGEPIRFNLSELGLPSTQVIITYAQTEDLIKQQLIDHGVKFT